MLSLTKIKTNLNLDFNYLKRCLQYLWRTLKNDYRLECSPRQPNHHMLKKYTLLTLFSLESNFAKMKDTKKTINIQCLTSSLLKFFSYLTFKSRSSGVFSMIGITSSSSYLTKNSNLLKTTDADDSAVYKHLSSGW